MNTHAARSTKNINTATIMSIIMSMSIIMNMAT